MAPARTIFKPRRPPANDRRQEGGRIQNSEARSRKGCGCPKRDLQRRAAPTLSHPGSPRITTFGHSGKRVALIRNPGKRKPQSMDQRGFWIPARASPARRRGRLAGMTKKRALARHDGKPSILSRVSWISWLAIHFRGFGEFRGYIHLESSRKPAQHPHLESSRKPAQRAIRDPGKRRATAAEIDLDSGFRLALPRLDAGVAWPE